MELSEFITGLSDERKEQLKQAIDKRFGQGYFSLNAGIYVEESKDPKYEHKVTFCNFNSVSGWATIGGIRFDEKKKRYVISFQGRGLGRTGRYN